MTQLTQMVLLLAGGAAFVGILVAISRSAIAGAILALAAFLLFQATSPLLLGDLVFQFGSISVYPYDLASLALFVVGVARLFSEEIYGPAKLALGVLVASLVLHLLWGISEFGVEPATNQTRTWFPIVSGILYGATVRNWDRRLISAFIATGCVLATFSVISIARHGVYEANTFIMQGGQLIDARPVIASSVLVMLEALIMLVARGRLTAITATMALLLVSAIALLQYRTLWVASLIALVLGAFALAVRHRPRQERLVYSLSALALVAVPAALFATSQVQTYRESTSSAFGATSTFTWRLDAWKELLGSLDTPTEILLGTPSGTSREIVVNGLQTNLNAHSLYVEAVLLYGLVGFVALCILGVLAVLGRRASSRQLGIPGSAIVILLVCQALVTVTHLPTQSQGLLLGAFLSAICYEGERAFSRRRAQAPRQSLSMPL